ncbi:DMT family transporter [Alkaliphilus transvaalensis]|uniref:DMT family transporter n=1 Tax=Alkaliphilus transvaalensis TaxID=114628 RepID=UPI00047E9B71|nr:DMT family transporter [Alkaliphilus transvaalensis]
MESIKKATQIYFILIMGVVGISFSAIFIRYTTAPSSIIAMYRMGITFLIFLPFAIVNGRKEIKKISRREYLFCGISGFFLALHFVTWIASLNYTTVASSTMIVSLQPLFTVGIGYLVYQERISKRALVGMGLAIVGSIFMGLINYHGGSGNIIGDGLALAGAFFGALYIIIGRGMRKNVSLLTYGFIVYGSCTLTLVLINLMMKVPFAGYPNQDYLLFLLMAIVCTIGGHTVFNWGLKYIEANKISTFMLGEPVGASLWAIILLREIPSKGQFFSSIIILSGLWFFMKASVQEEKHQLSKGEIRCETR